MTKKQNTLIFMLCATLVNLLLIFGITALLLFICILLFKNNERFLGQAVPFMLIFGIVISMIIYNKLAGWVIKKYKLEDKLDPIFTKKR